jgi:6-phosphogluconolactonase
VPTPTPEIKIVEDLQALSLRAAELIVERLAIVLKTKDVCTMVLAGGSTPRNLYSLLAGDSAMNNKIPWERVHFFWGDERHVASDHPESNFRMANEAMLSRLPIAPQNIHRVMSENSDAGESARLYAQEISSFFKLEAGQIPRFDCVLLGMGPDGHTASLFPETPALTQKKRLVAVNWVEKLQTHRITLTAPVFNNAECIIFLVSGANKAETLKRVLEGEMQPQQLPAQLIQPFHGKLYWIIDRAAAGELGQEFRFNLDQ